MDVLIARLAPVTAELKGIREQLAEHNRLFELYLQSIHGLTTRVVKASQEDLRDTAVAYTDPSLQRMFEQIEASGKVLTEDQRAMIAQMVSLETDDEE